MAEDKRNFNWIYDEKDDSFYIMLTDKGYENRPVKISNWSIDENTDELSYTMTFTKTEDEEKMKSDNAFKRKVEEAFMEIILKAQIAAENEQQYFALLEATFRSALSERGLSVEEGKLALEYALELDYKVDLDGEGKLTALDLKSKEPIDIQAVIAAVLIKHPTNKLILE